MDTDTVSDQPFGQCRCCLNVGYHKDLTKPYYNDDGVREIYRDKFLECFNLLLSTNTKLTNLICKSCICRLNNATEFMTMVVESERQLLSCLNSTNIEFVNVVQFYKEGIQEEENDNVIIQEDDIDDNEEVFTQDAVIDDQESIEPDHDESIEPKAMICTDTMLGQRMLQVKLTRLPTSLLKLWTNNINPSDVEVAHNDDGSVQEEENQEDDVDCSYVEDEHNGTQDAAVDEQKIITSTLTPIETSSPSTIKLILKSRTSKKHEIIKRIAGDIDNLKHSKDKKNYNTTTKGNCENKSKCINVDIITYNELLNEHQANPAHDKDNPASGMQAGNLKPSIYSCDLCKYTTNTKRYFISHLKAHSATRNYICNTCSYTTTARHSLVFHIRSHTGEKPYTCEICDKKFALRFYLSNHIKIHTGERPFACKICDLKFSRSFYLSRHIKKHTVENPFGCKVYGKMFRTSGVLSDHIRIHTGEKLYTCKICNKTFNQSSMLVRHARIHTGEKPYACKICNKTFNQSGMLVRHARIHTDVKPYACMICDKKMRSRSNLDDHMRIHTGGKSYACKICDKIFTRKTSLTMHARIHTGEKPHICVICDNKFRSRSNLHVHLKTHTGVKPYACKICDKKFAQNRSLSNHAKIHTV